MDLFLHCVIYKEKLSPCGITQPFLSSDSYAIYMTWNGIECMLQTFPFHTQLKPNTAPKKTKAIQQFQPKKSFWLDDFGKSK